MNMLITIAVILWIVGIIFFSLFIAFTRSGKNLFNSIIHRKKYVICHLKMEGTDFVDTYKVVPEKDHLTHVAKGQYNLNPAYSILRWKGRLHFLLFENDTIPKYINRTGSNDEIMFQTKEITTALENRAYDFLYQKNKNIALIIAGVGLFIAIMVALYAAYEISQVTPILQWLYEHPPKELGVIVPPGK